MPVKIVKDGIDNYLVPAPLVNFSKEYIIDGAGEVIGNEYTFTLEGVLLPNRGNPIATSGAITSSFSTAGWASSEDPCDDPSHGLSDQELLISTMAKQEELRRVFSGNAVQIELIGYENSQGIKFVGDVVDIDFGQEGRWILPCPYTITMRTSNFVESVEAGLFPANSTENNHVFYVQSASEDWALEEADLPIVSTGNLGVIARSFVVSHNVNAVGQRVYESGGAFASGLEPWQQASGYVNSVIGLGFSNFPSGLLNPATNYGYQTANRTFTEAIDKRGGGYTVTESFFVYDSGLLPSGTQASETVDFSVDRGEDGVTSVTINGSIEGFYTKDPTSGSDSGIDKYPNATGYFNTVEPVIYERAKKGAALSWLNPIPRSIAVSRNPGAGTVNYSYAYTDTLPNLIPGSLTEDIQISDVYPRQIIATIPVIGRSQPILQYVNSRSEHKRTLQINASMSGITQNWANSGINASGTWAGFTAADIRSWLISEKPSATRTAEFSGIYEAANPAGSPNVIPSKVFYTDPPSETWNPKTGQYSFTVGWTYETSG